MFATRIPLWTALLLLLFPALSHAHAHMSKSQPTKGEVLTAPPAAVQLWFSATVDPQWSKIEVTGADGERIDTGPVTAIGNDSNSLQINLKPVGTGSYEVKWSTASRDGHRIKGSYSFSVK